MINRLLQKLNLAQLLPQIELQIKSVLFLIKTTLMYGFLAVGFSLIGLILPGASPPGDPLASATVEHIGGHIVWGMIAALAALSFRHIFAGGLFTIVLDADHLVNFLNIDVVIRMDHSIPFALLALIVMMLIFGRKDFLLGSISFAAVFSHLSFDTFLDAGKFPILTPFSDHIATFEGTDWIILQLVAISAVVLAKLITDKKKRLSVHRY